MPDWVLGVDIGTTGCKAVVFDESWKIRAYSYKEYNLISIGSNQFDLNPQDVWFSAREVIIKVNKNIAAGNIKALAVSAIGDVIIPLDENNLVVRNSIVDFDPRGTEEIKLFSEKFGTKELFDITGMPPLFINSLSKILWIKKNEPDKYGLIKKWVTYEDYILSKMNGENYVSYSLAARTMLFDIRRKKWSKKILEKIGLKEEMLSRPIASGEFISNMDNKIAEELGFKGDIKLCSGGHDMVCAAIGAGLDSKKPEVAVDITGTIEGIVTAMKEPNTNNKMLQNAYPCYPGYDDYVSFSVNLTSGCIVKWMRDEFFKDVIRKAEDNIKDVYEIIFEDVSSDNLGNIFMVPDFAGSGNPDFDPDAKGFIYGLDLNTSRKDMMQGLIEGLCLELRSHLEGFENSGISISALRAVGGGSKAPEWLQLKANITGKKVIYTGISESSALGAAMLAARAVGLINDFSEVADRVGNNEKEYLPKPEMQTIVDKKYKNYKKLKEKIKF